MADTALVSRLATATRPAHGLLLEHTREATNPTLHRATRAQPTRIRDTHEPLCTMAAVRDQLVAV